MEVDQMKITYDCDNEEWVVKNAEGKRIGSCNVSQLVDGDWGAVLAIAEAMGFDSTEIGENLNLFM